VSNASAVLLLNSTYEPLNVINFKRAVRLLIGGKADSIEGSGTDIRSGSSSMRIPDVLRLTYFVHRPIQRVKFTKYAVFLRDNFTCQYCGVRTKELTIDHVIPKVRGGETIWTNVVACCKRCNNSKGDKTVKEAGFMLKRIPKEPRFLPYLRMVRSGHQKSWDKFLFTDSEGSTPYLIREELPNR